MPTLPLLNPHRDFRLDSLVRHAWPWKHGTRQVSVTVHRPAAFKILMRTSTQGRTKLYLLGKHAPKGGPLIDTKTYKCDGAAGSWYCKGSYEALPAGTYTFRVVFTSSVPTNPGGLELTVRW